MIYDNLSWLPEEAYTDEDVSSKTLSVYQHIYSNYSGGGQRVNNGVLDENGSVYLPHK